MLFDSCRPVIYIKFFAYFPRIYHFKASKNIFDRYIADFSLD